MNLERYMDEKDVFEDTFDLEIEIVSSLTMC